MSSLNTSGMHIIYHIIWLSIRININININTVVLLHLLVVPPKQTIQNIQCTSVSAREWRPFFSDSLGFMLATWPWHWLKTPCIAHLGPFFVQWPWHVWCGAGGVAGAGRINCRRAKSQKHSRWRFGNRPEILGLRVQYSVLPLVWKPGIILRSIDTTDWSIWCGIANLGRPLLNDSGDFLISCQQRQFEVQISRARSYIWNPVNLSRTNHVQCSTWPMQPKGAKPLLFFKRSKNVWKATEVWRLKSSACNGDVALRLPLTPVTVIIWHNTRIYEMTFCDNLKRIVLVQLGSAKPYSFYLPLCIRLETNYEHFICFRTF